ncbi:hypothetical protein QE152_g14378 [Popillia japonica]|uniref:CCHC-type domain-containing protein n=1 Tax=Popillia japonica TaxID=7064 RepID=A0AAW1L916_POPJA
MKHQILIGLWSKTLCSTMFALPHSNTDDLLHDLYEYQAIEGKRLERIPGKNEKSTGFKPALNHVTKVADQRGVEASGNVPKKTTNYLPPRDSQNRPLCFKSGNVPKKTTNYLPPRDSQNRPLCFKCRKYGHVSKYCKMDSGDSKKPQTDDDDRKVMTGTVETSQNTNLKYFHDAIIQECAHDSRDQFQNLNIGESIDDENREKLKNILIEYEDCFATDMHGLGTIESVQCKIETTTEEPITYRPYRPSYKEREEVREIVDDLKGAGIIVDSTSPYASPITTIDMMSGYYQIPVEMDSQHKTAFITPDGLYCYILNHMRLNLFIEH